MLRQVHIKNCDEYLSGNEMSFHGVEGQKVDNFDWHQEVFDQMSLDPRSKPQKLRGPNDVGSTSIPLLTDEDKKVNWTTKSNPERVFRYGSPHIGCVSLAYG